MKSRSCFIAFPLFCVLFLFPQMYAQSVEPVSVEFTVLSLKGSPKGLYYFPAPGEQPVALTFNRRYRSEPYTYIGSPRITFFRLEQDPESENMIPIPVTTATLRADSLQWLILFDKNAQSKWTTDSIDDSADNIPVDHLTMYNGTSIPLFAKVGEGLLKLPPGLSKPVPVADYQNQKVKVTYTELIGDRTVEKSFDTINTAIPVIVVYQGEDRLQKLEEARIQVSPGHRYLWILLKPEKEGSTRFRTKLLSEVVEPPEITE